MFSGVQAISIVEYPAIESDFVALKKEQEIRLAEVKGEKRVLMGPALIPNKTIYRRNEEGEYYIYFSRDTVRKASELFLSEGNQNKSTMEHSYELQGLSVVESWIVESEQDKSRAYGFDVPIGTWMVSMKVYNDQVWEEFVKEGKVKGFSIEGYFADKVNMATQQKQEAEAMELMEWIVEELESVDLESYSDYGDGVKNNAKRGRELNEKQGNKCATPVGKKGQPISKLAAHYRWKLLSVCTATYQERRSTTTKATRRLVVRLASCYGEAKPG